MDLQIKRNGNDITNLIISYDRTQNLCSGIGQLIVTVEAVTANSFDPWDEITVFEDFTLVGTYYVSSIDHSLNNALRTISCQDGSKKLVDTFVDENLLVAGNNNAKYWIEYLTNLAGVTCNFTSPGTGGVLNPDAYIGLENTYNLIIPLLQQSGWYIYFDPENTAIIGKINVDLENVDYTLYNHDILSLYTSKDDKMLRNRAVVWGLQDVATSQWVFADVTTHTPWNYDQNDIRTVLYSNSSIPNTGTAYVMANKIIEEFARITYTHTIEMPGFYDLSLGSVVYVDSDLDNHIGLLTSIKVSSSSTGFKTTIILDERCPRLFGYVGSDTEYVYISTLGAGVKRKPLDGLTWTDYSAGLLDFNVTDLMIKHSIFSCVAQDGYGYLRTPVTSVWSRYLHPNLVDLDGNTFTSDQVKAVACDINATNYNIVFAYVTKEPFNGQYRSWAVEISPNKALVGIRPLYIRDSSRQDLEHIDIDFWGEKPMSVATGPLRYILETNPEEFWGIRDVRQTRHPDVDAFTYGPLPSETPYLDAFVDNNFGNIGETLYIKGQDLYIYGHFNKYFKNVCFNDDETFETLNITTRWNDPSTNIPNSRNSAKRFWIDPDETLDPKTNPYQLLIETFADDTKTVYFTHLKIKPLLSEGETVCANILPAVPLATTENITLSGVYPIDGKNYPENTRVLVKDQADTSENGIYQMKNTAWIRVNTGTTKTYSILHVYDGVENIAKTFQLKTPGEIIFGITELEWEEVLNVIDEVAVGEVVVSLTERYPNPGIIGREYREMTCVDEFAYWASTGANTFDGVNYYISTTVYYYNMKTYELGTIEIGSQNFSEFESPIWLFLRASEGMALVSINMGKTFQHGGRNLIRISVINRGNLSATREINIEPQYEDNIVFYGTTRQATIIPVGYNKKGSQVETFVKFRMHFGIKKIKPACQEACPGVPGWEWKEYQVFGGLDLSKLDYSYGPSKSTRGYDVFPIPCCTNYIEYDELDYTEYNFNYGYFAVHLQDSANYPLTSSTGNPVFIHDGRDIYSSITLQKMGELEKPANSGYPRELVSQMDDFDNSIYIMEGGTKTLYKEKTTGGVWMVATCSGCPGIGFLSGGNSGNVSNGYYIHAEHPNAFDTGFENGYTIFKFKNSVVMSGLKLVYLLDEIPASGYTIKDYDFYRFKLEESYDFPLTSYTIPSSVAYFTYSGQVFYPEVDEHFRIYDLGLRKFQYNNAVNDVTISNFTNYSGEGGGRYMFYTNRSGEYPEFINTVTFGTSYLVPEISGYFGQIEGTNFKDPNYIFLNIASGVQQFYQRQGLSGTFINASINLPTDQITSIRADDIL